MGTILHIDQADYQRQPPARIKFRYVNWRNELHEYVVDCESVEFGPYDNGGKHDRQNPNDCRWVLHAEVVTRDKIKRLNATSRRTFVMSEMKEVVEVR
jgi:hypothetical protein